MVPDNLENGVYYDINGEEFCEFALDTSQDSLVVSYCVPHDGDVYFTQDADEFDESEFIPVDQDAIEDPASYLQGYVDTLVSGDVQELVNMSGVEDVSLLWASQNASVVEE